MLCLQIYGVPTIAVVFFERCVCVTCCVRGANGECILYKGCFACSLRYLKEISVQSPGWAAEKIEMADSTLLSRNLPFLVFNMYSSVPRSSYSGTTSPCKLESTLISMRSLLSMATIAVVPINLGQESYFQISVCLCKSKCHHVHAATVSESPENGGRIT